MEGKDNAPPLGHATGMAALVGGETMGVAPEVTIVSVNRGELSTSEWLEQLKIAQRDIKKMGREEKSIVVTSLGLPDIEDEHAQEDIKAIKELKLAIAELMASHVPVVVPTGNFADKEDKYGQLRPYVDTYPALFESGDAFPIITVGSVNAEGKRCSFSQGGPQVTISAAGCSIPCLTLNGKIQQLEGTSLCRKLNLLRNLRRC